MQQYPRHTSKPAILLCLLSSLYAYATGAVGRDFDFAVVDKIETGTSKSSVKEMLGEPYVRGEDASHTTETWIYRYSSVTGAKTVTINFVDDKVVQVVKKCNDTREC